MNTKEKLALLKTWQETYQTLDKAFDDFETALGCNICESKFFDSCWNSFQNYTKAIALLLETETVVGVEEWLSWYCYENGMGEKEMEAKARSWKRMRKIKTLTDLLKVIEE